VYRKRAFLTTKLKEMTMSNAIITYLKAELAKFESNPDVETVETDAKAIGVSALNYIKSNGLTDLYNIALAALTSAATGTSFAAVAATVVSQGEAAGITIAKGAESVVLAQAQADLVAQGAIVAPTTGAIVASAPTPAAASSSSGTSTAGA
jgi:hypothetical protein